MMAWGPSFQVKPLCKIISRWPVCAIHSQMGCLKVDADKSHSESLLNMLLTDDTASTGLAENRCLQRKQRGAKLLQIGEQEVAFGAKFKARVVLDIEVQSPL